MERNILSEQLPTTLPLSLLTGKLSLLCFYRHQNISSKMRIAVVGTVLFMTAIGLYQLFIHKIQFHSWLQIDNVEELETNLIGVLVVVPACCPEAH